MQTVKGAVQEWNQKRTEIKGVWNNIRNLTYSGKKANRMNLFPLFNTIINNFTINNENY